MFKNLKQTNFKLQNLDQVYTRLLNKKIEHAQIKKVNSVTKIIGAQAKILNNINYYLKKTININTLIDFFDYFILILVILTLAVQAGNFILLLSSIINYLCNEFFNVNSSDLITCMVETNNTTNTTNTTTTKIIHSDGSWSNAVISIFIYGSGVLGFKLLRNGGTPGFRTFIILGTLAGLRRDALSKFVSNSINDPEFVKIHYFNWLWKTIWLDATKGEASVYLDKDAETLSKISEVTTNKFASSGGNLGEVVDKFLNGLFDNLKFLLEPVQVDYSNAVLAEQIHDLSIILFIFSILIIGMIIVLLFNIFIYINMDKIIKFFNNKFIKWYLVFNKKFIAIEIFMLGSTIIYFMYNLSVGIRFIATHPIIIN